MTEYEPYGARHFLREADAEGASELRRRQVALAQGGTVPKGEAVDTDELDPDALLLYRTLVLRRSPVQSRPAAAYELVWAGDSYEVWQRPAGPAPQLERLPLGDRRNPVAVPGCADVHALARRADGTLVAAERPAPIRVPLGHAADVSIRQGGDYDVWLPGSVRPRVDLFVDGAAAGSVRHVLNNQGQFVLLGSAVLEPGEHRIAVNVHGPDLHPGSGPVTPPVGPLILTRAEAADARLVRVAPGHWRDLCGREWDWIETDG